MNTPAAMTSRERVNRMFARQDHDRMPRHEGCWLETLDRWMAEGLPADNRDDAFAIVLDRLGGDLQMINWYWPHSFPGRQEVLEEDEQTRVTKGPSGTIERFWKNKSGTPEHLGWECGEREIWETTYKPAMVEQAIQIDVAAVEKQVAKAARLNRWTYLAGVGPFEVIRKILGDEQFMMNLIDEPEWIEDMARVSMDNLIRNYQVVLDAGIQPDGLWIFDDMAFRTATFCSPAMYRELLWPQHLRLAEFAHANRMKFVYHTDGDVRRVIPDYIEAGFDCLQPLEAKANMDVRELVPQYGERLAFFGNIDVTKLITNDLGIIEEEVASKLAVARQSRGYMYHSDHSVPPQVSWQTYQALIGFLDKYGTYD